MVQRRDKVLANLRHAIAVLHKYQEVVESTSDQDWPWVQASFQMPLMTNGNSMHERAAALIENANQTNTEPDLRTQSGELKRAVQKAVRAFRGNFTIREVLSRMEQNGFSVKAKRPVAAVGAVLGKLVGDEVLTVIEESSGNTPTVYRRSIQQKDT